MENEEELKKQFLKIVKYFEIDDNSDEIMVWDEIVEKYSNFDGGDILKSKTKNAIKLLNETKKRSLEEFNILMKRNIEDDVWYII